MAVIEISSDEVALSAAAMQMTVRLSYLKMSKKEADGIAMSCARVMTHLNECRMDNIDTMFICVCIRKMLKEIREDTLIPKAQVRAIVRQAEQVMMKFENALSHPVTIRL
jgi:Asp-tRNA(Asn)/Glu-tRNA(Gln) amidotransferase C subunit